MINKKYLYLLILLISINANLISVSSIELSDETSMNFTIGEGIFCESGAATSFWVDSLQNQREDSVKNCNREDAVEDYCCPSRKPLCSETNECIESSKRFCWDFNDEDSCLEANSGNPREIIKNSADFLNQTQCGDIVEYIKDGNKKCHLKNCECKWESDECNFNSWFSRDSDCSEPVSEEPLNECLYTLDNVEDRCDSEEIEIWHFKATSEPEDSEFPPEQPCIDVDKEIPCEAVVKLDFFDEYSFIFSVLILILIYFFTDNFGKRKNLKFPIGKRMEP